MSFRKPVAKNRKDKPVIIFENGNELNEFPTIQAAAKWLKEYTGLEHIPYRPVENGIFLMKHGHIMVLLIYSLLMKKLG